MSVIVGRVKVGQGPLHASMHPPCAIKVRRLTMRNGAIASEVPLCSGVGFISIKLQIAQHFRATGPAIYSELDSALRIIRPAHYGQRSCAMCDELFGAVITLSPSANSERKKKSLLRSIFWRRFACAFPRGTSRHQHHGYLLGLDLLGATSWDNYFDALKRAGRKKEKASCHGHVRISRAPRLFTHHVSLSHPPSGTRYCTKPVRVKAT